MNKIEKTLVTLMVITIVLPFAFPRTIGYIPPVYDNQGKVIYDGLFVNEPNFPLFWFFVITIMVFAIYEIWKTKESDGELTDDLGPHP